MRRRHHAAAHRRDLQLPELGGRHVVRHRGIVRYTNGLYYIAEHDNPGYDPVDQHLVLGARTPAAAQPPTTPPPTEPGGFVVSEAQFNQMFPSRNSFYTYSGLVAALSAYPAFANTGSDTVQRQEAAAFLANVNHETGGLVYIVEQNTANYPHYCDPEPALRLPGRAGRLLRARADPAQLELQLQGRGRRARHRPARQPELVQTDAAVAWKTGLWYWNTQNGPGHHDRRTTRWSTAPGSARPSAASTARLECNGGNPAQVQSRVTAYQQFVGILGVSAGANLYC